MFPPVVQSVIGRVPDGHPAAVEGYRRLEVAGEVFPGLIKASGSRVEGVLYLDLSKDDWERLTAFEDDFYELEEVTVFSSGAVVEALAYVVPPSRRSLLSEKAWDPESFRKNHLLQFSRPSQPHIGPEGEA
jgi:Gamma-glutamyl cyclotransferase, AIG2-like